MDRACCMEILEVGNFKRTKGLRDIFFHVLILLKFEIANKAERRHIYISKAQKIQSVYSGEAEAKRTERKTYKDNELSFIFHCLLCFS